MAPGGPSERRTGVPDFNHASGDYWELAPDTLDGASSAQKPLFPWGHVAQKLRFPRSLVAQKARYPRSLVAPESPQGCTVLSDSLRLFYLIFCREGA